MKFFVEILCLGQTDKTLVAISNMKVGIKST